MKDEKPAEKLTVADAFQLLAKQLQAIEPNRRGAALPSLLMALVEKLK